MKDWIKRRLPLLILLWIRRTRFYCADQWEILSGRRDPLVPPQRLLRIGDGDFGERGREFLAYHVELARASPRARILDVGCGVGRMALPLARYLDAEGSYEGFDIMKEGIEWCQRFITPRHPNFRFRHADVFNPVYNPSGPTAAAAYRFPYPDASFDYVFLTSVFTHMLPEDLEHYLSEIARVLRPGGTSLITYFLLNPESRVLMPAGKDFKYEGQGFWTTHPERPEEATAYDEAFVRALYPRVGLEIVEPVRYGSWCARTEFKSYQDIVIATRRSVP